MSLDNIQLPAIVLQDLFKKSLIDLKLDNDKSILLETDSISYLGENKKEILILVNYSTAAHLPDEDLHFLLTILNACKLTIADVAILNLSKNPQFNCANLNTNLSAKKIILFGIKPSSIQLSIQLPLYTIEQSKNQTYLYSNSLTQLQANKEEKMKLWNCLKQLFN